jgi:hypothetical protein
LLIVRAGLLGDEIGPKAIARNRLEGPKVPGHNQEKLLFRFAVGLLGASACFNLLAWQYHSGHAEDHLAHTARELK